MDAKPDTQLLELEDEPEELRPAPDEKMEELKHEKQTREQEKQAWNEARKAWEVERESFVKWKRTWDSEKEARALEKEFNEEHQAPHSHFMQMIRGIENATVEMVEQDVDNKDGDSDFVEAVSEEMVQQQMAEEPQQQESEKEKCKDIIGNVRRVGKQWLELVEAATKEDIVSCSV